MSVATVPEPMLAVAGELPTVDDGWQFEFKWDGVRLLVVVDEGRVAAYTRNGRDAIIAWPELAGIAADVGAGRSVLDGEIVVMNDANRPDFGLLQERMHVRDEATAARLSAELPATLLVFDLLELGGHDLRQLPLEQRRDVLERLSLDGPAWKTPPVFRDDGEATLDAARTLGLEGVVAKRLASPYLPGTRSPHWRKIKLLARDEFVVIGYTAGSGRRSTTLGALLLGVNERSAPLGAPIRFVGAVGTGFDDAELRALTEVLRNSAEVESDLVTNPEQLPAQARLVEPAIVCEVKYSGWTRDHMLRHPSYAGLRADKPVDEVFSPTEPPR